MSAVATAETLSTPDAATLHVVEPGVSAEHEMHAAEQKRWMVWFGLPALVGFLFVALTFGTGDGWWMALAIAAMVVDIFVLVWLAMTSDTNGVIGEPASAAH